MQLTAVEIAVAVRLRYSWRMKMGLGEAHEGGVVEASPISSRTLRDGFGASEGKPLKQRLLVVANRLPVSAFRHGEDSWSLEISAGGLVSALLGMKDVDAKRIGWACVNVPNVVGQKALRKTLA
ncbi:Alpha,alpha-trehalose-phosphate synthase [UDP-forming] 1 [Platanthera guangdongensis]|uniref:Alpha,alpha-trehalose-phosphate synthase [UDP-forming] 1 n=1 Tax=Platanthera guangdongensis TaxID=2320717 RepID=A0ABR2N2Z0_9ASPA